MAKFTFTIETDNEDELTPHICASPNYFMLWELKNNFWRRWKHMDGSDEYVRGVNEVLDALQEELQEFKGDLA